MNDPFKIMPHDTAVVYKFLQNNPLLSPFILIGGTGLALHIGHRQSEDLDFITLQKRLPKAALMKIQEDLKAAGHTIVQKVDAGADEDFETAGMDASDYTQTLLIDGKTKLTFFTADTHHANLLKDTGNNTNDGFRIGTFTELCQLKAAVAASRSKSRDWIDLFLLERDHQFGLKQWKEAYDKAGYTDTHLEQAFNRICSGKVREDDEGFLTLMPDPPSVEEIAQRFRDLRKDYEVTLARNVLKKGE